MIEAVLMTVAVTFAALGICDFIHTLRSLFLFPKIKTGSFCIVFLKAGYAQDQLRYFAAKLRWYGNEYCNKIIAVTDELSESDTALCEKYCYCSNICLCRLEEVEEKLSLIIGETDEGHRNT